MLHPSGGGSASSRRPFDQVRGCRTTGPRRGRARLALAGTQFATFFTGTKLQILKNRRRQFEEAGGWGALERVLVSQGGCHAGGGGGGVNSEVVEEALRCVEVVLCGRGSRSGGRGGAIGGGSEEGGALVAAVARYSVYLLY
jgi:hypothetical protein